MRGRLSTSFSTDRVGGGRLANFAAEGENESTFWQSKFVDGHLTFRSLRLSQAKCRFMGKVVREISRFFVTPPRVFSLSLWRSGQTKRRFALSYEDECSELKNVRIFVFVRMFVYGRIFIILPNIRPF